VVCSSRTVTPANGNAVPVRNLRSDDLQGEEESGTSSRGDKASPDRCFVDVPWVSPLKVLDWSVTRKRDAVSKCRRDAKLAGPAIVHAMQAGVPDFFAELFDVSGIDSQIKIGPSSCLSRCMNLLSCMFQRAAHIDEDLGATLFQSSTVVAGIGLSGFGSTYSMSR